MDKPVDIIAPVTALQQEAIIAQTHSYITQALTLFEIKSKPVDITFDLRGRAAGMYRVSRTKREIRYNRFIFSKYYEDNFKTTIPHEVAHYVTDMLYGLRYIKPHGKEWQSVMLAFDADAAVTANYDLTGIPLNQKKTFRYQCTCQDHMIGVVRHNRIQKNRNRYFCKLCKQLLRKKF